MGTQFITRRGISMAETILSTVLVGFVLVSTLQIVGPIVQSTSVHADRLVAANLANELAEEIATKLFTDPQINAIDALGVDAGERAANRIDFDDVDDYQGWASTPPKLSNNNPNNALVAWTRSVKVVHVALSDATTETATNTGLKRVTVIVSKNGVELARINSLHSQAADTLGFIVKAGV